MAWQSSRINWVILAIPSLLSFRSFWFLPRQALLTLLIPHSPHTKGYMRSKVVRCKKIEEKFILWCEFFYNHWQPYSSKLLNWKKITKNLRKGNFLAIFGSKMTIICSFLRSTCKMIFFRWAPWKIPCHFLVLIIKISENSVLRLWFTLQIRFRRP